MLNDKETYSIIDKNPSKNIESKLTTEVLKRWLLKDFISKQTFYLLKNTVIFLALPKLMVFRA